MASAQALRQERALVLRKSPDSDQRGCSERPAQQSVGRGVEQARVPRVSMGETSHWGETPRCRALLWDMRLGLTSPVPRPTPFSSEVVPPSASWG